MDDHGAVVDPVAVAQRGADGDQREQLRRARRDRGHGGLDAVEQRVLEQQVVDRVAAQPELGEDGGGDALLRERAQLPEDRLGVGCRVGDRRAARARRDPREAVGVRGAEVHGCSMFPSGAGSMRAAPCRAGTTADRDPACAGEFDVDCDYRGQRRTGCSDRAEFDVEIDERRTRSAGEKVGRARPLASSGGRARRGARRAARVELAAMGRSSSTLTATIADNVELGTSGEAPPAPWSTGASMRRRRRSISNDAPRLVSTPCRRRTPHRSASSSPAPPASPPRPSTARSPKPAARRRSGRSCSSSAPASGASSPRWPRPWASRVRR